MKNVVIMRGLPGSGKSTWVSRYMMNSDLDHAVVSADHYHSIDGKYDFKQENAKAAHDACLLQFIKYLNHADLMGVNGTLIVDNTNISAWEIAPYYRLAEVYGIDVEIVLINCATMDAINRNRGRGTKEVPHLVISRMAHRLEMESLPSWWKQILA